MHSSLSIALVLSACSLLGPSPQTPRGERARAVSPTPTPHAFATPREGLNVPAATAETDLSLAELLDEFTRVTGETFTINKETRQLLQVTRTGLNHAVLVPPAEVYFFVETLLMQSGFAWTRLNEREPRLLSVHSLHGHERSNLRTRASFVQPDELAVWARHPAFLITTVIHLPNTDVRTLSNSMRTMFTDADTQQIIPVGNSNSLIVTGFGHEVARLVGLLRLVDEASRTDSARRPTPVPEKAPKVEEPPQEQSPH